jgi:glycine betaine/proline transport system substrate-binding protein
MRQKGFRAILGGLLGAVVMAIIVTILLVRPFAPVRPPVIRIADTSWQSNVPIINIMKIVLEDELGYEVEFVPTLWGPDTFAALAEEPPDVDIFAENWMPNGQALMDEYVTDKGQAEVVATSYVGRQGFVVPSYVIEGDSRRGIEPIAPDLRSVRQLNDYVALFDRDGDGRGDLVGGPEGWVCTHMNDWQIESWELHYDQIIQDEWISWSMLTSAYYEGEPFLCYLYEPTWPVLLFGLTWLETPAYSDGAMADYETWQDWKAGKAVTWEPGRACGYPPSEVLVVVTDEFGQKYPDAHRFLQNWFIPVEDVTDLSVQIELHNLPAGYVAFEYIEEHPELVTQWLAGIE